MEETQFSNLETQQKLPNATAVLVLGILSIITCCCYGILSIILGIVGIVLANKDMKLYSNNPSIYSNVSNVKTGRILSIIGIILGLLFLLYMIWLLSVFGLETIQDPDLLKIKLEEYFAQ